MRVPIDWLKDVLSFRASADQLAEMLTMAGLETMVVDHNVLEIDVLPNRCDCWSILGIAREVSALTKLKLKPKIVKPKETGRNIGSLLKVEVRERQACPRYMARVVENVKIAESPAWLKKRLEAAGIRPINNVVDVTNYLLLELGQPMHAFDADLVENNRIIVRFAHPQEKITTLDGQAQELDSDTLVIADSEKAIAVAGIMGGANSEVSQKTKTIILESACFDPVLIHKTSKNLKTRTESSVRFEHGVDWQKVEEALDRAANMLRDLAKGQVCKGKIDIKKNQPKPRIIELRPERLNQVLGCQISTSEIANILKRLGFKVSGRKVTVPTYRLADIEREIDLIEEVARIYGYARIKPTMPGSVYPGISVSKDQSTINKITEIMVGCGFNQAQTYSMQGPEDFEKAGLDTSEAIKVSNPMNVEESLMRTSILPGLLNVASYNLNRQVNDVFVFEVGKVFAKKEKYVLAAVAIGSPFMSALDKGSVDYYYIKGVLENLFNSLGLDYYRIVEGNSHLLQPGKAAEILGLGLVGELNPEIKAKYGIKVPAFVLEIDLEALLERLNHKKVYKALPKFPSVDRDVALYVPKGIEHQMIMDVIKKVGDRLLEKAYLFDKYKDSLAYRLVYRNLEKTLTDQEVNAKHQEIINALESKLNVRVRT